MLNRRFGPNTHSYLHLLGLSGIAFALPWSKVMMSISMMFVVLNLIVEADYANYWKRLKSNRIYWLIIGLVVLHGLAVLWSSNLSYAIHDLKVKLPLLVIPTVLCAKPVTVRKHLHIILLSLLSILLITSVYNYISYQQWLGPKFYDDIRGMSLFGSHIRFGLLVSMGVGICLYLIMRFKQWALPLVILTAWFTFYTIFSQVISGVVTLAGVFFIFAFYQIWIRSKVWAGAFTLVCLTSTVLLGVWLFKPLQVDPADYPNLESHTKEGNPYTHNFSYVSSETGEPVLIYLCEEELKREWNRRSSVKYGDTDVKGNPIFHTLIRYLSSRKLRKDAAGVNQLSHQDIINIQNGCPTVNHHGLMARLHGIRFELNQPIDPNGHSLLQRLEYWKAGMSIASDNWLLGVGTGDVQDTFDSYYERSQSQLLPKNRKRAHSQFVTVFLTFGIFGLLFFVFLLARFAAFNLKNRQLLALFFITIASLSFIFEDTLETQTGVTFFALFFGLFSYQLSNQAASIKQKGNVSKSRHRSHVTA